LLATGLRRYFGTEGAVPLSHFFTVLRDKPVRLAISLLDIPSRKCIRLTFPNISMVITLFAPAQKLGNSGYTPWSVLN
jgi:hypothetical protein